jgi:hypothetical protein
VVCAVGQSHLGQCPVRTLTTIRSPHARIHQWQLDVAPGGHGGEQVELLEHEADLAVPDSGQCALAEIAHVLPAEPIAARGRDVEAAEDVHQRRLARP